MSSLFSAGELSYLGVHATGTTTGAVEFREPGAIPKPSRVRVKASPACVERPSPRRDLVPVVGVLEKLTEGRSGKEEAGGRDVLHTGPAFGRSFTNIG